jgi:hypothetical protein
MEGKAEKCEWKGEMRTGDNLVLSATILAVIGAALQAPGRLFINSQFPGSNLCVCGTLQGQVPAFEDHAALQEYGHMV